MNFLIACKANITLSLQEVSSRLVPSDSLGLTGWAVLFLWDYFITLDREVEYIWKSRFSAASGLFFLNRYLNLLITILELIVQAPFLTPEVRLSNIGPRRVLHPPTFLYRGTVSMLLA